MELGLDGKVALITGGSKGIGRAAALGFLAEGASVLICARGEAALDDTVAAAGHAARERIDAVAADLTDPVAIRRVVARCRERFGRVDILINNAGIVARKPITAMSLAEWNNVLQTNLTSAFLMCRAFVPHMTGRDYGRIINIASAMAHRSLPGRTAYSSSKSGLLGFTRALALELAGQGVTVVSISPGVFATELIEPVLNDPKLNGPFVAHTAVGRWGRPEEIGQLVLYLCSDDASFITGSDIAIDGGWTAQ